MSAFVQFDCEECRNQTVRIWVGDPSLVIEWYLPTGWHLSRHLPPREHLPYITCPNCFEKNKRIATGDTNGKTPIRGNRTG